MSRLHFDEKNRKYSHCCCHIRIAAIVIGCLQLIGYFYDLGNYAILAIQKPDDDDYPATGYFLSSDRLKSWVDDNETSERKYEWFRQRGIVAGLVWDSLTALSIIFTFYGIHRVRSFCLIPQLVIYAATATMCMILAFILIIVAFRAQLFEELWLYILITMAASGLYGYFFHIILRTYGYLVHKRRFLNDSANVYIVPVGRGIDTLPHENYDVPPAYPGLLTEVNEQQSKGVEKTSKNEKMAADPNALPTYDEAQKLQPKVSSDECHV